MRSLSTVAAFLLMTFPALAQWEQIDVAHGPSIKALAVSKSTSGVNLFAAHSRGAFVSRDTGASWSVLDAGLPVGPLTALAVIPAASGNNLFAGTENDGVFLSTNEGTSWSPVDRTPIDETNKFATAIGENGVFVGPTVLALAVIPFSRGTLLMASINYGGVYRSTDFGKSWTRMNDGLINPSPLQYPIVRTIVADEGYLFAGTSEDGVFLSTNNGKKWSQVSEGLPTESRSVYAPVNALGLSPAADRRSSPTLYAATSATGVFRTTDDGRSWSPINSDLPSRMVNALVVVGGVVFAGTADFGIYLSTNGGGKWIDANAGFTTDARGAYFPVTTLAVGGDFLFAGTSKNGVWKRSIAEMLADVKQIR